MDEIEFENEQEATTFQKGQTYIAVIAILNAVEIGVFLRYIQSSNFLPIIITQFVFGYYLYMAYNGIYEFYMAAVSLIGVVSFCWLLVILGTGPWRIEKMVGGILPFCMVIHSIWALIILRKKYVVLYVNKTRDVREAEKYKNR